MSETEKQFRGFAAMDPDVQREIARKGGNSVSAGQEGREHMSRLGKLGGAAVAQIPGHMAKIGAAGGAKNPIGPCAP